MALDWENIDHWEAGEIALLTVIAFLLALLCVMLACILYYGKIYYSLKRNEGQPLYKSDGGDGPYNQTVRPHSYREDSSDEDDHGFDEENNINMSSKAMRKSFGHGAMLKNRGALVRYNTNTTNQSASTESDSQTTGTSDEEETETLDTQSKLKRNSYRHEDDDGDEDEDDDEEDSDVINHRNRHHIQRHAQRGYNYIGTQHPMSYQGQYGNEIMQQHHNNIVSHPPLPPPGVIHSHPHSSDSTAHRHNVYNVTPSPHKNGHHHHRTSNTTTSLTTITATEHRGSNYFNKDYVYSPSDKESRRV